MTAKREIENIVIYVTGNERAEELAWFRLKPYMEEGDTATLLRHSAKFDYLNFEHEFEFQIEPQDE